MKSKCIKIIECFAITGRGLLTELQHFEDGIPPNTRLIHSELKTYWIVKRRVLSSTLSFANAEIHFDCETEVEYMSHSYKTQEDRQDAIDKELYRRKEGIYWYLLTSDNKNLKSKPRTGSILQIETI